MNNSKKHNASCSKINKQTLCTFYKDQSWIYYRDPLWPGSGNNPEAHCTLICFNFHTCTSRPSLAPSPAVPLWIEDGHWGGGRSGGFPSLLWVCAEALRFYWLMSCMCHCKGPSLMGTVTLSWQVGRPARVKSSMHWVCWRIFFSYHLATQVWNTALIPPCP